MTVAELITLLQQQDQNARGVVADGQEFGHIRVMQTDYIKACTIRYPHPFRAPKFSNEGPANAVFIGEYHAAHG
jgi:hypothetical protein